MPNIFGSHAGSNDNVGSNGDAFAVANNTTMTIMDLLTATDAQAVDGVLYGGNATKRAEANSVYTAINRGRGRLMPRRVRVDHAA